MAMIYRMFCFFVLTFSLFSTTLYSQKILAFDKQGQTKRIKYHVGDYFRFKTTQGIKHEGFIAEIKDSTFILTQQEFNIRAIAIVFNTQKNAGFELLYNVSIRGAFAYLPLVSFNRLINDDDPIVKKSALFISGSMLGVALISRCFANKPYKISKKRPLRIIDLSI